MQPTNILFWYCWKLVYSSHYTTLGPVKDMSLSLPMVVREHSAILQISRQLRTYNVTVPEVVNVTVSLIPKQYMEFTALACTVRFLKSYGFAQTT